MESWRLGLDVGSNSVGWAALRLDQQGRPAALLESEDGGPFLPGAGVRIFSDGRNPKDKQSLAAQRRAPRGMRRNRDRYLQRRHDFLTALIRFGLFPADEAERKALESPTGRQRQNRDVQKDFDPWQLRARALDEPLTTRQIGRALFHLQQRRGFKSNRKADKEAKDGKISKGAAAVIAKMQERNARTLGELFGRPRLDGNVHASTRARLNGEGAKAFYDFYPTRDLILDEFEKIWAAQKKHHPSLMTEAARAELFRILSFQRPLKPQPVGRCAFEPDTDLRASWALPSSQRRRLFETLNALYYREPGEAARQLTLGQRTLLAEKALGSKDLTFDAMRRTLKLHDDVKFNIESEKRKKIEGDHTAAILANKNLWGKDWRKLPSNEQEAIVELLLGLEPLTDQTPAHVRVVAQGVIESVAHTFATAPDEAERLLTSPEPEVLAGWLSERFGLSQEAALSVVEANLPEGHQALGRRANAKILRELMADDMPVYDKAVLRAGYKDHRAIEGHGEIHDRKLPYYGEILGRSVAFGTGNPDDTIEKRVGKIANPSVHVALNQLRKVVNRLISRYGPPAEIVIEFARDLPLGAEEKRKLERDQAANQKANEARQTILAEYGVQNSPVNRLKLRLFEELTGGKATNGRCVLSGEQFGYARLLSDEIEIDHILPFALTLDDSFSNKILVTRRANRDKARRDPYAFATEHTGYDWEEISGRAADLPPQKSWRFSPDAMARYEDEERDFLERQLNDTKYIARLTQTYLGAIYGGGDEAAKHIWVTPGRLTSDLRAVWGLNRILDGNKASDDPDTPRRKNRDDHRHHAIDAIVVALTDRSTLKRAADHAKHQNPEISAERMLAALPEPWEGFRQDVERHVNAIVVSHKKDHGVEGQLHEDTNYGVVQNPHGSDLKLATRKAIVSFENFDQLKDIADNRIREELMEKTSGLVGADFKQALHDYVSEQKSGRRTNPRRVRLHKPVTGSTPLRTIHHGRSKQYNRSVLAAENYCLDIFETPDGKWQCQEISRFDANMLNGSVRSGTKPDWMNEHQEAVFVMRLRKGDIIGIEDTPGEIQFRRVVRLEPSANRVRLARDREAGDYETRHKDKDDLFSWDFATISKLKARKARLVHIDEAGRVFDPGPRNARTDRRSIE